MMFRIEISFKELHFCMLYVDISKKKCNYKINSILYSCWKKLPPNLFLYKIKLYEITWMLFCIWQTSSFHKSKMFSFAFCEWPFCNKYLVTQHQAYSWITWLPAEGYCYILWSPLVMKEGMTNFWSMVAWMFTQGSPNQACCLMLSIHHFHFWLDINIF